VLDAKGFDIRRIGRIYQQDTIDLSFNYDGKKLEVLLDRVFKRNETLHLFVDYVAKPNEITVKGSEAITEDKGLYFINPLGKEKDKPRQIWTQGETEASSCWFPTFDAPNVKTKQEIFITVDTAFRTISNGTLVFQRNNNDGTRTDYWKQDKPHAPYLFAMAIGKYAEIKDQWRHVPLFYYVEPEYAPYAKDIFGNTPEMMEFFSKLLDYPYPWDKYAQVVVRDFVSGAMENTSVSIFMEQLQVDKRSLLDHHWDAIIAHELFHHWFGNLVTCESWANLPLNESFANYSEYLWLEYKYGVDEADLHWQGELEQYLNESIRKQEPLIRYYYRDKEDMFDSHSYAKGGLILHYLRKIVGEEAFRESLQLYLKQNAFKKAEIHQLRLAFEEVTGEDLNWFFDQWFLKPGHPDIFLSEQYENGVVSLTVRQRQDLQRTPL
ncbi:MAG: M1 family metallopeptidase, partial [Flammeovirgaceae bacterium]|nr:M1 family metallopeptidase [Flammeovirgaceae bacterium]